jgi:hypothetical protein
MGTDEIQTRPMQITEFEAFQRAETQNRSSRNAVFKIIRWERKLLELDKIFVNVANVECVEDISRLLDGKFYKHSSESQALQKK